MLRSGKSIFIKTWFLVVFIKNLTVFFEVFKEFDFSIQFLIGSLRVCC